MKSIRQSVQVTITIYAFEKGYYVDEYGVVYGLKGNTLKTCCDDSGYLRFTIKYNKKCKCVYVHKLQAYQKFKDLALLENIHIRHMNNIKKDNSFENINIGSQQDNCLDIPKHERSQNASNPKYNHENIIIDRNIGMSYKEIMSKYKISSKGTVSFIINKSLSKTKNNLGLKQINSISRFVN